MESSQVHGDPGECRSSESGWTTYIASPSPSPSLSPSPHNDHLVDDIQHYDGAYAAVADDEDDGDYESDDSMASDAASVPSHQDHPFCMEHSRVELQSPSLVEKPKKKKTGERSDGKKMERETQYAVVANSAFSFVHGGVAKVPKTD